MADETPKKESSSDPLSKKIGPFSLWVWLVMGAGIAAALVYRYAKGGTSNTGGSISGTTSESQIPQIVNETYSTTPVTVNSPVTVNQPTPPPEHRAPSGPPANGKPVTELPKKNKKNTGKTYTVQPGDNLYDIGKAYGVAWQTIYDANKSVIGGNPNLIKPGQHLKIPDATKTPKLHNTYFTVRRGDSLSEIARKYDTTWEDLYAENRKTIGSNPNLLRPGEKLIIQKNGIGF